MLPRVRHRWQTEHKHGSYTARNVAQSRLLSMERDVNMVTAVSVCVKLNGCFAKVKMYSIIIKLSI